MSKKPDLNKLRTEMQELLAAVQKRMAKAEIAHQKMEEAHAELGKWIDLDQNAEPQVRQLEITAERAAVRAMAAYKRLMEKVDDAAQRNERPQPADR